MNDDEAVKCMACDEIFNMVVRKHHCRKCGALFCDKCCQNRLLIPKDLLLIPPKRLPGFLLEKQSCIPQRCCTKCCEDLKDDQLRLRALLSKANQHTILEREAPERYLNSPVAFSLEAEIRKATYTLLNFTDDNAIEGSDRVPKELLWRAKGIAFLTVIKAGFFLTGRVGSGLVIRRLVEGGWSAPSAIALSGAGWGLQFGGEVTDVMIVLNTDKAVDLFASDTSMSIGTELGVSIGPVGRSAGTDLHASESGVSSAFSYAHSKGFFIGVSLEAAVIAARPAVNRAFYGESAPALTLLSGSYPRPKAADPLYLALDEVLNSHSSHRPSGSVASTASDFSGLPVAANSSVLESTAGTSIGTLFGGDSWSKDRARRLQTRVVDIFDAGTEDSGDLGRLVYDKSETDNRAAQHSHSVPQVHSDSECDFFGTCGRSGTPPPTDDKSGGGKYEEVRF